MLELTLYSDAAPDGVDRLIDGAPSGRTLPLAMVASAGTTSQIPPDVAPGNDIQLLRSDAAGGSLSPGQELRVTLEWLAPESCCEAGAWSDAELILRGEGWEQRRPVRLPLSRPARLAIPADAGSAVLALEGENFHRGFAAYTITAAACQPVGARFEGVGTLEGYTGASDRSRG